MRARASLLTLILASSLLAASPTPSEAGLLDSIKGIFSKGTEAIKNLFGGGKKASDTASSPELTGLLDQVEQSQAAVNERQAAVLELYKQNPGASDPNLQSGLNALSTVSTQNEQLYLNFLKVRGELQTNKVDTKSLEPRFDRIAQTQGNIEQSAQQIAELNRGSGVYTPPTALAGDVWANPQAQKYIDEWLSGVGVDEWGRLVSPTSIDAAGTPDTGGKIRHQWVWETMADSNAGSSISLRAYVMARLQGQTVQITPQQIAATVPVDTAGGSATGGTATADPGSGGASTSIQADVSSSIAQVDASLKVAMKRFEELSQDSAKATSDEAKSLLETIKALKERKQQLISLGTQKP